MQFSLKKSKKNNNICLNNRNLDKIITKKTNIIKNYNYKNRQNTHKNKINRKNLCKYRKSLFTD